jgi:hypothetical protein
MAARSIGSGIISFRLQPPTDAFRPESYANAHRARVQVLVKHEIGGEEVAASAAAGAPRAGATENAAPSQRVREK